MTHMHVHVLENNLYENNKDVIRYSTRNISSL